MPRGLGMGAGRGGGGRGQGRCQGPVAGPKGGAFTAGPGRLLRLPQLRGEVATLARAALHPDVVPQVWRKNDTALITVEKRRYAMPFRDGTGPLGRVPGRGAVPGLPCPEARIVWDADSAGVAEAGGIVLGPQAQPKRRLQTHAPRSLITGRSPS